MSHLTVPATTCSIEYVDGVRTRVLPPGRHRVPRRSTHVSVSLREQLATTAPQEVPTADGVSVKVTAAFRWAVGDAVAFCETADDPVGVVHLAVQLALRASLLETEAESVVRRARAELDGPLLDAARTAGAQVGVDVRAVEVKDVVLPADLRAAHADLVATRARGQARLEAARAETAALRSLANGAKLLDAHPALARQRLVEALPPGSRVEIVAPEA
ncbi:slipin family protein [Nocardioides litoris]|uniref:slipin family protein n=1 Tax=Nocardioides litoris TaxID=1926648 RepID=UPI00112440A7|nr:slipin family protein [Nocardioides litoris]